MDDPVQAGEAPGVVITSGSVQAPEELYWFGAASQAKAGYVVMTCDAQGQGRSDTYGEGVDRNEGVPAQNGRPFYDQTEDGRLPEEIDPAQGRREVRVGDVGALVVRAAADHDLAAVGARSRGGKRALALGQRVPLSMLSRYFRSRLDIGRGAGARFVCEDLRAGCPGLAPDGLAPD